MSATVSCHALTQLWARHPIAGELRGVPSLTSEERRQARYERRQARRAARRAERQRGLTLEAVADVNNLIRASMGAASGVRWKASTQRYEADRLRNCVRARSDLLTGDMGFFRGFVCFDVVERGKLRHIASVHFYERVIQKSLCQNVLVPALTPSLIDANTANQRGKGTHYALRLMRRQLARHYRRHGTEGYILQIDFKEYFASIAHQPLLEMVDAAIDDERVKALVRFLVSTQGDVGLGLGSEPNQIMAISFPSRIDHHVTECCGVEAYGRYMDDSYLIDTSKERLWAALSEIEWLCCEMGITLNARKTRMTKLSHGFTFLKKKFSYGENGRIVMRPCRDAIVRERRKLKALRRLWLKGDIDIDAILQSYQSWRGGMLKADAHRTVLSMDKLYHDLFGGCR